MGDLPSGLPDTGAVDELVDDLITDPNKPEPNKVEDEPKADEGMNALAGVMKGLADGITSLGSKMDQFIVGQEKAAIPPPVTKEPVVEDDPDFDLMTNTEIMGHMVKGMSKMAEEIKGVIEESVGEVKDVSDKTAAEQEARQVMGAHPDLGAYVSEIKAEIKAVPGLSLEKAYYLAKINNPDKVAEVNAAANKDKEGEDEDKVKVPSFGGLTPTSGISTKNQRMKPLDAAAAAWNEVMEGKSN